MKNSTHLIIGTSSALFFTSVNKILLKEFSLNIDFNYELFFIFNCIGSIFPDVDIEKSWISKLSPIPFCKFLRHRKQTHSNKFLFILVLLSIFAFYKLEKNIVSTIIGFTIGIYLHLKFDEIYSKTRDKNYYCKYENILFYLNWFLIFIFLFFIILY